MKIPVVQNKDYVIYLEYYANIHWLHADVFRWTKEVKNKFIKDLDTMQSLLNDDIFALIDNDKLEKFAKLIGFTYVKDLIGKDNNIYKIYHRSLTWVD
jgi:hypothetical protein